MKNYELLYILPSTMTGEEISTNFKEIIKNIEKLGGEMLETLVEHPFLIKSDASKEESSEELKGLTVVKKKLAYPIEKNKFGFYCLINFSTEGEKIKEMDNYLKMNNNVLRHIIVQEDPMTKEELAKLHKLFARKRAEQEKEEKQKEAKEAPKERREEIKAPEIKPVVEEVKPKKVVVEKKEKAKEEVIEKEPEKKETEEKVKTVKKKMVVKAPEEKVVEEKPKAKKVIAEKEEKAKEEVIEKEAGKEKEVKEKETPKKEESKKESSRKKKIKLEDLEDKLDEILEDTML